MSALPAQPVVLGAADGLRNIAAVRAFSMAIEVLAGKVRSSRSTAMRLPPLSTTAIEPPGAQRLFA